MEIIKILLEDPKLVLSFLGFTISVVTLLQISAKKKSLIVSILFFIGVLMFFAGIFYESITNLKNDIEIYIEEQKQTATQNAVTDQETQEITPTPNEVASSNMETPSDCWNTIWSFSPESTDDIDILLTDPRSKYYQLSFDSTESPPGNYSGSLKLTTAKQVADLLGDSNSWSWINNFDPIYVKDVKYRIRGWIKTQNSVESHISVVAQNSFLQDIVIYGTNQLAKMPIFPKNGSYDWKEFMSNEFNPMEWSNDSEILVLGINAGPSYEGGEATTWFTNIEVQICESEEESNYSDCDGMDWSTCWVIDDTTQTMTWVGFTNGISDIGQSGEALNKLHEGYTALVYLDKELTINICSGSIDGIKPEGDCPKVLSISEGSHEIISPGRSGGFRIYE